MPKRREDRPRVDHRAKLPLVYILSTGRSGSTLLDVLLGAQAECWTLGEFQLLDIGAGQQMRCGCRRALAQCRFWGPLLDRIRRTMRFPIGHFRSGRHPHGKVVRWALLPSILAGRPLRLQRRAAREYAISNFSAMAEARHAAEQLEGKVAWLVDASKDPYRLLWLQASGHFDIRVIHLVRRPQGFVCNMMRSAGSSGVVPVIRYAGRWLVDNLLALVLLRRLFRPETVKTVRYEALAADPEAVIGGLCAWLGLPFDPGRTRTTRFQVNHGVAGNRPRWDDLAVRFDEPWRTAMPIRQQRLVAVLTRLLRRLHSADPGADPGADRGADPRDGGRGRRRRLSLPWLASRSTRP